MSRRSPRGTPMRRIIVALIAFVAVLSVWTMAAAAATQSANVGVPVTFSGVGFTANETIAIWETAPGGATTALPDTGADGSGRFSTSVSFSSAGQWSVTAHGKTSGKETVGVWQIGATTAASAAAPSTNTIGGTGTSVAVGAPASFSGNGFTANETIAVWETAPDSTVTALPDTGADGSGAVMVSVTFPTAGQWQVTVHGKTSAQEKVGIFQVGGTPSAASSVGSPSPALGPGSGQVAVGAPVTFSGTGFTANEAIAYWRTGPDTKATALPDGAADANGAFSVSVTFPAAGQWAVTAHGKTSSKEVVGTFTIGDATSAAAPVASGTGSPSSAAPATTSSAPSSGPLQIGSGSKAVVGSTVMFSATGFTAGEAVSLWVVKPGNALSTLDGVQADANGVISVQVTLDTEGPWQVIAQGQRSGHAAVTPYQATAS